MIKSKITVSPILEPLSKSVVNKPPYQTIKQSSALSEACQPATFGANNEAILDETYRKAGKMDVDRFATSIVPERTDLMKIIRAELLEGADSQRPLNAPSKSSYQGSFFKAHLETPRSESMFGSLVLMFPTPHEGGSLILRHQGEEWTVDTAKRTSEQSQPSIGFVSFFSDVEHEVSLVESGHRVTLTFNLYYDDILPAQAGIDPSMSSTAVSPVDAQFRRELLAVLADPALLPSGGMLGFGLRHVYPIKKTLKHVRKLLKGSDAAIERVCRSLALKTQVYLCYHDWTSFGDYEVVEHVISPKVPTDLDTLDWSIVQELKEKYGAKVVRRKIMETYESPMGDEAAVEAELDEIVEWATLPRSQTVVKSGYIAYGNDAQQEYAYGHVCLMVRIPKAEDRAGIMQRGEDASFGN
ncbi:hypothetical protein EWM64_g8443 [Hericium alpestre]|uniref:Prolyl 4-hydroxylase alpha subunit Fe(2+) 2OG dioxygenase domain-containing protein n=1 Tax=Hericium alpestre TaxID=135208 RepID=A0A4Y9ZMU4_9AGAM|nr:hypothetical protein EWM64_g8443 [Hericium alpestre]